MARARLGHAHGATQAPASARESPEMERAAIRPQARQGQGATAPRRALKHRSGVTV